VRVKLCELRPEIPPIPFLYAEKDEKLQSRQLGFPGLAFET
jgi:hypothetical protein